MLNILKAELLKLKKDTMFFTGTIISMVIPVFIVIKDKYLASPPAAIMDWIMTCGLISFLILSALSGFIITNLVHKEYQAGTMANILSSSVSRAAFIFAKLAVWFLWYAIMLAYIEMITILGSSLLYPSQFNGGCVKMIIVMFTKLGLLSFLSLLPLLWVTILQRKLFYPCVLAAIGFTGIFIGGFNISMDMVLPASIVPWTAVPLAAVYQVKSPYIEIGMISIIVTGIAGLLLALRSFYRQDQ